MSESDGSHGVISTELDTRVCQQIAHLQQQLKNAISTSHKWRRKYNRLRRKMGQTRQNNASAGNDPPPVTPTPPSVEEVRASADYINLIAATCEDIKKNMVPFHIKTTKKPTKKKPTKKKPAQNKRKLPAVKTTPVTTKRKRKANFYKNGSESEQCTEYDYYTGSGDEEGVRQNYGAKHMSLAQKIEKLTTKRNFIRKVFMSRGKGTQKEYHVFTLGHRDRSGVYMRIYPGEPFWIKREHVRDTKCLQTLDLFDQINTDNTDNFVEVFGGNTAVADNAEALNNIRKAS